MTPYPYQQQAFDLIKSALRIKKDFLLSAPCAAGKTFIFSMLCRWMYENSRTALVLLDCENLVSQTADKIRTYLDNPVTDPVGIACATAQREKQVSPITVASRQTFLPMLKNGYQDIKFNMLIFDECHLINPKAGQYFEILEILKKNHPEMRIFGCTATPYRLKGGKIYGTDRIFERLDHQITAKYLTEQKYIVPLKWKARQSDIINQLNNLKAGNNGELNENEQYEIVRQNIFIESVYDVWQQHCRNRKTAIFALNIAHADAIGEVFRKMNTQAWVIHSDLNLTIIERFIADFIKSDSGVIINVGMLTTGSDIPCITAIILARKTLSTSLFFQIVGRGARICPPINKTDCLIIDLGGNYALHGNDPDHPIIQTDTGKESPTLKLCPICEDLVGNATRICPICGFIFPEPEKTDKDGKVSETAEAGEIVDLAENQGIVCDKIRYNYHWAQGKSYPTVWIKFYTDGKHIASQWICPEHPPVSRPAKIADSYWEEMWGTPPAPRSVEEFLSRTDELSHKCEIFLDYNAGKYPKVTEIKNTMF